MPQELTTRTERIRAALAAAFSPDVLDIVDESHLHHGHAGAAPGGETHYAVHIRAGAFARTLADYTLLEVGLGGRLDATNVVESDVAMITSIALDHCDWLGDTREAVAVDAAAHRLTLADGPIPAARDFELAWTPDVGAAPGAALFTQTTPRAWRPERCARWHAPRCSCR